MQCCITHNTILSHTTMSLFTLFCIALQALQQEQHPPWCFFLSLLASLLDGQGSHSPHPNLLPIPRSWNDAAFWLKLGTGGASLGGIQTHRCAEIKLLGMFQQGNFSMRANLLGRYFSLSASAESPPSCFCLSSYPRAGGTQKPINVLKTDRLQNGFLYLEGQKSLRKRGMLRLL